MARSARLAVLVVEFPPPVGGEEPGGNPPPTGNTGPPRGETPPVPAAARIVSKLKKIRVVAGDVTKTLPLEVKR